MSEPKNHVYWKNQSPIFFQLSALTVTDDPDNVLFQIPQITAARNCKPWWILFIENTGSADLATLVVEAAPTETGPWAEDRAYWITGQDLLVPAGGCLSRNTEGVMPNVRARGSVAAGTTTINVWACKTFAF